MVNLERTQADFIKNTVRNMMQNSRVGHVVQVYEHLEDDDNSNFEVDVVFPGEDDLEHRQAPVQNPGMDSIDVPRVGDKVIVEYLHGDKKQPVVRNTVDTNEDRAVKGSAGVYRRQFRSDSSPAGDGDLYLTGTTVYDQSPATVDYRDLTPQQSFVQIAKKADALDEDSLPMKLEMFDDPANGEAHITFEANKSGGSDSAATYGFKINLKDGSFKIVDANGYGIESDGNGNFTWHHESIDFSEGTTTSL